MSEMAFILNRFRVLVYNLNKLFITTVKHLVTSIKQILKITR